MSNLFLSAGLDDDVAKHRKKSKRSVGKKSNHKHNYQPCVFEYPKIVIDKAHGIVNSDEPEFSMGEYCPVCGKIGSTGRKWFTHVPIKPGSHIVRLEPIEEAKRELDPTTRTLPTFALRDRFLQKYVELDREVE